jgi:uncharacterized membrane protein
MEFTMPHSAPKHTAAQPQRASAGKIAHTNASEKTHTDALEKTHTDSLGLERLIFFSDAVFAIAITLLALDIRLPPDTSALSNSELLERLLALGPQYRSYGISFLVIGSFWITHHSRFRFIRRYDSRLLLLNLLLLMVIAFIPFPTAVLSEHGNRTATIFYALTIVVAGLLSSLMWWYAVAGNRLVDEDFAPRQRQQGLLRTLIAPAVFLLSIGIAFFDDDLAKYSWLLIAFMALYERPLRRNR